MMTETSIINLLTKQNINTQFPKLQGETVSAFSKAVADILYDDVWQQTNRLNILLLLQKWCFKPTGGHRNITVDNYDCYLSCINASDQDLGDFELKSDIVIAENVNMDTIDAVMHHHSILNESNRSKQQLLEMMQLRDGLTLGNAMFETTITAPSFTNLDVIQELNRQETCKMVKSPTIIITYHRDIKQQRIRLFYALLNFNAVDKLKSMVLNELGSCDHLEDYEIEFIEYLWKKHNVADEVLLTLLERFAFLYEKPLLRMCTKAMSDLNSTAIDDSVKRILDIATRNPRVQQFVANVIYELYACSGFNEKLSNIFNVLNV